MTTPARLRVEYLEARDVPVTFGVPWPDGAHLTLSFAPDGTPIAGAGSSLFAQLGSDTHAWQTEILRTYQTWAVNANVNIGVVADGGQPFDTAGAPQGDGRFGDIRIGSRLMGPDVLAVTAPYDSFGVWSGNVTVNAGHPISVGGVGDTYDLYTILLQESAHSLGVGNSPDLASPMYEYYQGIRTTPTADDVQNLQALYGARRADPYEGANGNGSFAQATVYRNALEADITTVGDVDTYEFTAPLVPQSVTVLLQTAGVSLLAARVSVFDSAGQLIGLAAVTDPLNGNVALPYPMLTPGGTYYIQVQANRGDVFGVGAYRLAVAQGLVTLVNGTTAAATNLVQLPDPEILLGTNDSLLLATPLPLQPAASDTAIDFGTRGSLARSGDVDFYKVQAPAAFFGGGTAGALVVTAWGDGGATPDPRVTVYSSAGAALPAEVLVQDDGTATVQVRGVAAGQTYYVRVASGSGRTGDYRLAGDFRAAPVPLPTLAAGTLTAVQPAVVTPLDLSQSSVCHFVLSSDNTNTAADSTLAVTVRDQSGQVVASFTVAAGAAHSVKMVLASGRYTVSVSASTGGSLGLVPFRLAALVETDPTGIQPSDPNDTPPSDGSSNSSGSTYTGPSSTTSQPSL